MRNPLDMFKPEKETEMFPKGNKAVFEILIKT